MPLVLSRKNFGDEVARYLTDTESTTIPALPTTPLEFFRSLKRQELTNGRYPGKTILEVANRTLSDLVVLAVAEHLLHEPIAGLQQVADEVRVLLGTEDNGHDVEAVLPDHRPLRGECFNVARSFFRTKLQKTRKKLRGIEGPCVMLIAFNDDAVDLPFRHRSAWAIHLPVAVDAFLVRHRQKRH